MSNVFDLVKVLSEPRSNHTLEINYHRINDTKKYDQKRHTTNYRKSSPKHTFLWGTRKEQKQQTA